MVQQKRWQTDSARELARVGAALGCSCGSWAAGLRSGALQPLLVPMTSSSLPRGLPAGEPTAGASSLQIWFWDSDVHSFLRIPQVAQTEWLPVSPKNPGIWPQTKFAWGQYSASPRPRWQSSALAQGTELRTCVLVSDFLKDTGTDSPFFRWQGIEKWVFPCTPVSRPRPVTKSFPTAWLW